MLHEWLSILATRKTNFQRREAVEWSDQLVREIPSGGYITEFAVDTITSYSEAERIFFQGSRRRNSLSISTWINMLVYEKGILRLSS